MLSKLRRFQLRDNDGNEHHLTDLVVALLESDYPPVTHLFYKDSKGDQRILPWEAVKDIDWPGAQIRINSYEKAEAATEKWLDKAVLLRRDILDALVIDLQNRRATRANDLWLEEESGRLFLKAADTTSWGVLRRLSRGVFGRKPSRAPYDWKYIEFLRGDPRAVQNGAGYHMRIQRLPAGEIASLSNELPYVHAAELLTLLPDPTAADTLEAMLPARRLQVFGELDDEQALRLMTIMAANDAVDLLGRLAPEAAKSFLERLPKERSDALVELLRYPEDTVGGIMTNDVVTLTADLSIREARLILQERLRHADFTHFIYVVDKESQVLRGTTKLRDLVIAKDGQRLEEIVNPYITTLDPLESAEVGAYRVINSHMAALPVVGRDNQLLGIVTVDAAVVQVAPTSWGTQAPKVFS